MEGIQSDAFSSNLRQQCLSNSHSVDNQHAVYYPFGLSGQNYLVRQHPNSMQLLPYGITQPQDCGSEDQNMKLWTVSELLPNGIVQQIRCNIDEESMQVWTKSQDSPEWEEINMDGLKQGDLIDLNENGERWEGDSLKGKPFGYGFLYNSENQLIYKGFMYEGKKVCYGSVFFGDVGITEYEGGFYSNVRYGYGRLYDKKNNLIYDGEWYNGNRIEITHIEIEEELKEDKIHFGIKELTISRDCRIVVDKLVLCHFDKLESCCFGKNCLREVKLFKINNCKELTKVIIGEPIENDENRNRNNNNNNNNCCKLCSICDCEKLKELIVYENEFQKCIEVELLNLPKLKVITTGEESFYSTKSLTLSNLPNLEAFNTGDGSFFVTKIVSLSSTLSNLPTFQSFIRDVALSSGQSFIIITNLDNLTTFTTGNNSFYEISIVFLTGTLY